MVVNRRDWISKKRGWDRLRALAQQFFLLLLIGGLALSPQAAFSQSSVSTPIFWADGITRADQLDAYAQAGFNTVVIRLYWEASPDGAIIASDLQPQHTFAKRAADHQLNVIYSLPPAPLNQETKFAYSGEAGPYRVMWANWTQRAIAQLRDTPNLIGWMLPDDPRSLPFANNQSYARWIAANYGNLGTLNQQWNTRFQTPEQVTLAATRQIIAQWRGPVLPYAPMGDGQARAYIQQAQRRTAKDNFAFHPAALALAHFQWDAYRGLLDFWAKTVRNSDPLHKIYSGQLPDYAQLLSLPRSIDVSVPSASPAIMEPDLATHNPQAVDIARRGGRFQAIAMLSTRLPQASSNSIARLAPSWMDAALAHGASGLAFDSWPNIARTPALRHAIASSLQRLQNTEYSVLWGQSPSATIAIILTPLADGATLRVNRQPTSQETSPNEQDKRSPAVRGVYGFGEDLVSGEPSQLVYALRWGTTFGNVDYLSPDELGGGYSSSQFGLLKRYSTVLLPQALSISPGMAQELASYVAGGGVIVTDLGIGAMQNGGRVIGLPPELTALLGVVPTSMQTISFNLQPGQGHPLLPSWTAQGAMKAKVLTAGDGPDGAAFAGPVTFGELLPGTVPLALAFDMTQKIPGRNTPIIRINRSWLTLRPFGEGSAIFAPFHMWSFWRPGHPGFDTFHGDLFARKNELTVIGAPSLTSTPAGTPNGNTLFCQAVNFPNAIALLNHTSAPNPPYRGGILQSEQKAVANPSSQPAITPAITPEATPTPITPTIKAHQQQSPQLFSSAPPATTEPPIKMTPEEFEALFGKPPTTKKQPPPPAAPPTSSEEPLVLTPEELEAFFGKPVVPTKSKPDTPSQDAPAPYIPELAPPNPPQPAVVQTSGAEYFLWRNALCVFPIGATPNPTPGRTAPLPPGNEEFVIGSIVRPTLYHPVVLYALVPGMEMKVLQPVPVRVQHAQGGALAANVATYSPQKIALRIWPNTGSAFLRGNEWRLAPGREGTVRISIFTGQTAEGYRIAPNSRHLVTISEFSSNDDVSVLSKTNHQLVADGLGRLFLEVSGQSIGIEIAPL